MNRPLFRARNLDPSKRIRLLVDQHDDNNNTLTNPSSTTSSSSSNNLLVSLSSTSNIQTSQQSTVSNSQLPQRCVPQMPFVSGMEREEESEYHLQNALDAQRRLGSAKIRAVPIPDVYEDPNSQSIYPSNIQLPKQLIRLQPLQLESDEPEYDMDKIDHDWFNNYGRISCPNLTHLEYETIVDKLENASTRTLISFDEAQILLPNTDNTHIKNVYNFWNERRTTTNSNSSLTAAQHQQLLTQMIRDANRNKKPLTTSALTSLLQTPIQSQQSRSLSYDSNDPSQPKIKRFKGSDSSVNNNNNNSSSKKLYRKLNHTDKLTQLLSSPTTPSSPTVHNLTLTPSTNIPQSILERLSPGNVYTSQQQQQPGRRRPKNTMSGTIKQGKNHKNLPLADLWSLAENTAGGAILLKAQLLEAAKKLQQKEELENSTNRRVILQDGSSILSNSNENINNSFDGIGTSIDDEESSDPWQFRPKVGCRYLRPIDQDQQQRELPQRSTFSSFYYVACSERGHLGKRRVRLGRGGRLLYDRHTEQENKELTDETFLASHIINKPVLWRLSSRPLLKESYRLHSYLTVKDHTMSLAHHYQSKSSANSSIHLNDSLYHVNNSLSLNTGGKHPPTSSSSIELDHPYSCSSRRVNQALRTLAEPQPPSPSSPPPLSSSNSISTSQQMMLISTPPTPPPSSTINNNDIDMSQQEQSEQQQQFFTKSSSFVLSPTTPFFSPHQPSYVIPSTPPLPASSSSSQQSATSSLTIQPSSPVPTKQTPSSCGLVQFVQLHRIHPPTNTHKFASSTPVTTSDS
ncbi:unnamed protein product [Adineta steineri]|uniref:Enhancer of polycomb-like N-terminal domain-containing protein n=1 Tax=Adineta steineri TaxID=433720 RepID=A0A818RU30_9BILA|nr:unnamed protein product [Adineta steineri]